MQFPDSEAPQPHGPDNSRLPTGAESLASPQSRTKAGRTVRPWRKDKHSRTDGEGILVLGKYLFKVWRANLRASTIREMEFRANFILGIIRQFLWLGVFILIIETVYNNTESLAGWSKPEVLIILALSRIVEGIIDVFLTRNIAELPHLIQTGEFDFHLIKPVPAQLYTAFRRINIYNAGHLIAGIVLLIYALSLTPAVSPLQWLLFVFIIGLGLIIYYCLLILTVSLAFTTERLESIWGFLALYSEPLTVPFDIFPRLPRVALTYLLPIAFVVFVPAQTLTDRLVWWQVPLAIVVTIIFLILANLAWRAGLRRYSSASS